MCERLGKPILNVACQEDPAFLGEKFDAVNLDMRTVDLHLPEIDYRRDVKNFVEGDARHLQWPGETFQTVVLGEFLEHATEAYAEEVLRECARVTRHSGHIVITFPYDDRRPEEQHEPDKLFEPVPGYTTYHRTLWSEAMLARLFKACGLVEVMRAGLAYMFTKPMTGLGLVVCKA